jgi:hypothetical protein
MPAPAKLNKIILKACGRLKFGLYREATSCAKADNYTLTSFDIVHASARTGAGRIFAQPSKRSGQQFVFANNEYKSFACLYLGLPPLITLGEATNQPGYDYKVQQCLADHKSSSPFIDANGNHASSKCPATAKARCKKHANIVKVLVTAAQAAGLKVLCEPPTHSLLLGQFSEVNCRRIFPKYASKDYTSRFTNLLAAVDMCSNNPDLTSLQKQSVLTEHIEALPALKDSDTTGLRLDISLEDVTSGEAYWIDATAVHTTSPSYVTKRLKLLPTGRFQPLLPRISSCQISCRKNRVLSSSSGKLRRGSNTRAYLSLRRNSFGMVEGTRHLFLFLLWLRTQGNFRLKSTSFKSGWLASSSVIIRSNFVRMAFLYQSLYDPFGTICVWVFSLQLLQGLEKQDQNSAKDKHTASHTHTHTHTQLNTSKALPRKASINLHSTNPVAIAS